MRKAIAANASKPVPNRSTLDGSGVCEICSVIVIGVPLSMMNPVDRSTADTGEKLKEAEEGFPKPVLNGTAWVVRVQPGMLFTSNPVNRFPAPMQAFSTAPTFVPEKPVVFISRSSIVFRELRLET